MTSQHQANENEIVFFANLGHNNKTKICHKCHKPFELNDEVIRFGHKAHRKLYHKKCFRRF